MEQREDKEGEEVEEDGVCFYEFILRHQHEDQSKVQREPEPGSPPEAESEAESGYSGLSFRSDQSKDDIIYFKSGQPLAESRSPAGSDSPLSVHSYPSRGSNRSTDIDLEFNNQVPTPPESFRRTYEELFQHQQEVICHQEVQRQQEVQNLQEVIRHQKDLLHQQEVQRQQEVQNLQEVMRHQKDLLRQQEIQLQAKRELKLKRLEDQLHLKSGKNRSHKSEREDTGSTTVFPTDLGLRLSRLKFEQKPPGSTCSLPTFVDSSRSRLKDKQNDQK